MIYGIDGSTVLAVLQVAAWMVHLRGQAGGWRHSGLPSCVTALCTRDGRMVGNQPAVFSFRVCLLLLPHQCGRLAHPACRMISRKARRYQLCCRLEKIKPAITALDACDYYSGIGRGGRVDDDGNTAMHYNNIFLHKATKWVIRIYLKWRLCGLRNIPDCRAQTDHGSVNYCRV